MQKIFFFLFLLLICPITTNALEFKEFNVLNGNLSLPFNGLNNVYTVYLNDDEDKMEFEYDLELDPSLIEIKVENNNYEKDQDNPVVITLINKETEEKTNYTFYLTKEETTNVFSENLNNLTEKANTEKIDGLEFYVIGSCFLTIALLFKVIVLGFKK